MTKTRRTPGLPFFTLLGAGSGLLVCLALVGTAHAQTKTVNVNCPLGQTIANGLKQGLVGKPLRLLITGPCVENVVMTRDDTTLEGTAPGTLITAASASAPTIQMDGARRAVLTNLDVRGGARGVLGTRGTTFSLLNCNVQGNTLQGVVVANSSTGSVDNCTIQSNTGDGVVAANSGSVFVTDTTIENNTGSGVIAVRNSHARVGQDIGGTANLGPVTIRGNARNGFVVTESSSGLLVGGVVENNSTTNSLIFVGRGSSGLIGIGSSDVTAPTTVQNGDGNGIVVEGGNATIVNTTVSGNDGNGIIVINAGSARIGLTNSNTYLGNSIISNGQIGLQISDGSSAFVGGNTISGNGTNAGGNRFGMGVFGATGVVVGNNTIQNNAATGIFVSRGGNLIVGTPGFGLPTVNTISGNGNADPNKGGIFVFSGATADIRDATITGNDGAGVQVFEDGVAELRNSTVSNNVFDAAGFNGGHGIVAGFRSTVRLRTGTVVQNNAGDGVQIFDGTGVQFRADPTAPVVSGNGGFGLNCLGAESSFSGNTSGISGGIAPGCTGF